MKNIPLASSSIDSNNLVLVMNGSNPNTTTNNSANNNNNKQTTTPQQQQPLFMNSQSYLPKQHQQQQTSVPPQPIIFFQNHLMPQTQNTLPTTNTATSTSSTPVQPTSGSNTSQNGENVVDVENFAKFQQEQAKQFTLFQQQQAAAFLHLAIQQKQLEVAQFASAMNMPLPNGFLIPNNNNNNTSTNFHGGLVNSQPIFIPNSHHNQTPFDHNSPMSESILSSSPSSTMTGLHHVHHAASSSSDFDAESTAASISDKSQVLLSNQRRTGPVRRSRKGGWSEEEDEMLRAAVQTYGGKNWKKIAETLQNRTSVQCLHRWQKVLNPNLVKGPWTKDEDDKILQLVKTYGPENWSMIASHLPGRIGKQCRERWYNHLDPSIKKEPWTEEEEILLLDAQSKLGNKWAEISKLIVGRTDNACKNHYNSLAAREKKKDTTKETTKSSSSESSSTATRKTKKPSKKEDSAISRARHKRSISDTAFYQNYQYESRDSGPLTLSPMAQSNNSNGSGGNSPNANNLHHANSHITNNNFFSNLVPPALFPFNSNPMMMQNNSNLMQQNVIPIFRQNNVQKQPATQNAFTQSTTIPNIDISSPNSLGLSTPTDLFHDLSAFEAVMPSNTNGNGEELTGSLADVQDTLINQVGSGLINNFDVFEAHESEVLIHSEDSNEEMNITPTPGSRNRPSTVFNEDMDFNEFEEESDLNNFLDDDNNDQINSGLFPIPFADRETKRKKFNHVFHNRSISFDVSQLGQNKDFFL